MSDDANGAEEVEWRQAAYELLTAFEEAFGQCREYDEMTNRPIPDEPRVELFFLRDGSKATNADVFGMRWFGCGKLFLWQLRTRSGVPRIPCAEHFALFNTSSRASVRRLAAHVNEMVPFMKEAAAIWDELGPAQSTEVWEAMRWHVREVLHRYRHHSASRAKLELPGEAEGGRAMIDSEDAIRAAWVKEKESAVDNVWGDVSKEGMSEAQIEKAALALAKEDFLQWVREVLDDE